MGKEIELLFDSAAPALSVRRRHADG